MKTEYNVAIIAGIFGIITALIIVFGDDIRTQDDVILKSVITHIDGPHYIGDSIVFSGKDSQSSHGKISNYVWDFDDNGIKANGELTRHTFTEEGVYNVTLTITDNDGKTDRDSTDIVVIPRDETHDKNLPLSIIHLEIATNISEMFHKKIKTDVDIIQTHLDSNEIKTPFDSAVIDDSKFFTCNEGIPDDKCPVLEEIRNETGSAYTFLFYYPNEIVHTDKKTLEYCIIEISTLNSVTTNNVENKWGDRSWCNSEESVLMTDLYHPRNKPMINVNSLLIEYRDYNKDRLGLINAYNLEELIKNNVEEHSLPTFNVLLLDNKNCVAAAISKTNNSSAIHMDEGIWQLSNKKIDGAFQIFRDGDSNTNCNQKYSEYPLDDLETINVRFGNPSENETSKLSKSYAVFEMEPVTDKDLNMANVNIFQDWHLLVYVPSEN